ncbi:MAG: PAS domain S-box protein [Bacteroidota bacterium]
MTGITTTEKISEEGMDSPGNFSSNAFFKALLDNTRDVIAVLDKNGMLSYISPSVEPMLGYSQKELVGKSFLDLIHVDDKSRISNGLKNLLKTSGEAGYATFRCLDKAGTYLSIEGSYRDLLKDIAVRGIILNMRNITESERAAEALRQSEARYRTVAETASDAIVSVDHNSTILFANRSTEKIFGYRIEELIGNNLTILMPEYLRALHNEGMEHHIHTGEKHIPWEAVAVPGLHKDGYEIPLEISFGKFVDNGNHIFTGIIRDVSERRRTEDELALRDNAIDMASEGMMITDAQNPENPLIYVNHGFEQITGYSKEEVLGKNGKFLEGPETSPEAVAEIYRIIAEQRAGKVEILNYRKDGTTFWNLLSLTPLVNSQGIVTNYIAVQTDITERKRTEEQIKIAFEKEKELSEMKSHFITTASHEFRTPLSAIISSAEILEYYSEKLSEDKRLLHLKKIQTAAKMITNILEEILAYNKADSGKYICQPTEINVTELCKSIIEDTLQNSTQHTISFKNLTDTDVAVLDGDMLRLLLDNLLSNAVKFSKTESTTHLTVLKENNKYVFTVEDEGIGIPPSDIERITEPFHRGTNAGNIQGTGLGLAIVKRMIDLHKGSLEIVSVVGEGTKVIVTLPEGK